MPGIRIGPASAYSPSLKGVRMVCTRPPGNARASSTTTRWPASRSTPAARSPARPAPTTTTGRSTGVAESRGRPSDIGARGRQPEELSAIDRASGGDGLVRAAHFVGLKSISVEGGAVGIMGRTYGFSEATWQLWQASSAPCTRRRTRPRPGPRWRAGRRQTRSCPSR